MFITAHSTRASRAARLQGPSGSAISEFERRRDRLKRKIEDRDGLTKDVETHVVVYKRPNLRAGLFFHTSSRTNRSSVSHLFTLQRHIHSPNSKFLVQSNLDASITFSKLLTNLFRSNSVRVAVTQRSRSQGGSQQISRLVINHVDSCASSQLVACELTRAFAEKAAQQTHALKLCNVCCAEALTPEQVFLHNDGGITSDDNDAIENGSASNAFLMTAGALLIYNNMPVRLKPFSMIDEMSKLATSELETGEIRLVVPHLDSEIQTLCEILVDSSHKNIVWASFVFLVFLTEHSRLRTLLRSTSITDVDFNVAKVMLNYGSTEISRRERLRKLQGAKTSKHDHHYNPNNNNQASSSLSLTGSSSASSSSSLSSRSSNSDTSRTSSKTATSTSTTTTTSTTMLARSALVVGIDNTGTNALAEADSESLSDDNECDHRDRNHGDNPNICNHKQESQQQDQKRRPCQLDLHNHNHDYDDLYENDYCYDDDENEDLDAGFATSSFELALQARKHRETTLCMKRKRTVINPVTALQNQSSLVYWIAALESDYSSVLLTLITRSKQAAEASSLEVLKSQSTNVTSASHSTLVKTAVLSAMKSAKTASSLLIYNEDRTPKCVTWKTYDNRLRTGIASQGFVSNVAIHACSRTCKSDQSGVACVRSVAVKRTLHSENEVCTATETLNHLNSIESDSSASCGSAHGGETRNGGVQFRSKFARSRCIERLKHELKKEIPERAESILITGTARGFVCIRARVVVSQSVLDSAQRCASTAAACRDDARKTFAQESTCATDSASLHSSSLSTLNVETISRKHFDDVPEPFCTPSNNLSLAITISESMRDLMRGRCYKNEPCRQFCLDASEMNESSELTPSVDEIDKPGSALVITDLKISVPKTLEETSCAPIALKSRPDAFLMRTDLSLTIAADTPIRLPELLDTFCTQRHSVPRHSSISGRTNIGSCTHDGDDEDHNDDNNGDDDLWRQEISLLLAAVARASEVNERATSLLASNVNSNIASSKRIVVCDRNCWPILTLFDVYRSGLSNVPRSFVATPWTGVYSASFDVGTSSGVGVRCSCDSADRRNHGKILMSQSDMDSYCKKLGSVYYVPINDTSYAAIPREARGVPHATVPGLHSYLQDYVEGLETVRSLFGIKDVPTVDSLQCMPFGPFTERLSPYVADYADTTLSNRFRNPHDMAMAYEGLAFSCDATVPDVSILREPLIVRASVTSAHDNIFATAHAHVQAAFGAACALARLSRNCVLRACNDFFDNHALDACIDELFKLLNAYHSCDNDASDASSTSSPCSAIILDGRASRDAAIACVLLNCIYPATTDVGDPVVLKAYASAPSAMTMMMMTSTTKTTRNAATEQADKQQSQTQQQKQKTHNSLSDFVTIEKLFRDIDPRASVQAKDYWSRFCRPVNGAWKRLRPLLALAATYQGSFDNSVDRLNAYSDAIDNMIRGAWCVHSPDGVVVDPTSPMKGVDSPEKVNRTHVEPCFFCRVKKHNVYEKTQDTVTKARGSIVGLTPTGLQQIMALLTASLRFKDIKVQYYRNEGQLSVRPSSAADILTVNEQPRSEKAISCVGVEGDWQAFGTRQEKLLTCKLQRHASSQNLKVMQPLFLNIQRPLPQSIRERGDKDSISYIESRKVDLATAGVSLKQQLEAETLFNRISLKSIGQSMKASSSASSPSSQSVAATNKYTAADPLGRGVGVSQLPKTVFQPLGKQKQCNFANVKPTSKRRYGC